MNDNISKPEFPWPKKGDRLFGNNIDSWHTAILSMGKDWGTYAMGYKLAADVLVRHVFEDRGYQDLLIFPIVYLYRQFLELQLKEIHRYGHKLIDKTKKVPNTHDIVHLWQECRKIMEEIWPDEKDGLNTVEKCIKEFQQIDPSSEAFRYPVTTDGENSLPQDLTHIDINNLSSVMDGLGSFLEGTATGISEMLDWKHDMESMY